MERRRGPAAPAPAGAMPGTTAAAGATKSE